MHKERRLKRLVINEEMLQYVLENPKNYYVRNGLPDDVSIYDMYRQPDRQTFEVVFQHDSWESVKEGARIPELQIEVHELHCDECQNEMLWDQKLNEQYCPSCNRKWETGRNFIDERT